MKQYKVYFEFFGKKMKVKVFARSEKEAREYVRNKVMFHKIEMDREIDGFQHIKDILGIFN